MTHTYATEPMWTQNLAPLLLTPRQRTPEAIALLAPGRLPLTYHGLGQHLNTIVPRLSSLGIGCHDRVAVLLPNGPEMATACLAIMAGAVCAPLHLDCSSSEFAAFCTRIQPRALVLLADTDSPLRPLAQRYGIAVLELTPAYEAAAGWFTLAGEGAQPGVSPQDRNPMDPVLLLPTSGTTAQPKIVPLTVQNLWTSASNIAHSLHLSAADRALNIMPFFHIHGLVGTLLASLAAGASIVCTPGLAVADFFDWLRDYQPTWYSAVPTMHQALLTHLQRHPTVLEKHTLRFLRSCSAPLAPALLTDLERRFHVPVIEAYGMTEAAHQVTSNPLPPRTRKPGSVGLPTGVEVGIIDAQGQFVPSGVAGEIVIRGANVMPGYWSQATSAPPESPDGWLSTGDAGRLDTEGYLFITGRLKEMINRGGEKIAPREVEETLLAHPAVAQAVTFALPHATLGEDVAAAVVLHASASCTAHELRAFVATRLAGFKVPQQVHIVAALPQGPTGKIQRRSIAAALGALTPPLSAEPTAAVAPQTWLQEQLMDIWREVLPEPPRSIQENFFQLGGDSLQMMQVIARVRHVFGVALPLRVWFDTPTVAALAHTIAQSTTAPTDLAMVHAMPSASALQPRQQPAAPCVASFGQQQLWLASQLHPDTPLYHMPVIVRLRGALQVTALQQTLDAIVARHAALRTTFALQGQELLQAVQESHSVPVLYQDVRQWPASSREAASQRLLRQTIAAPFHLGQNLLLRGLLLQLDDHEHVLLLVIHHIAFDAASRNILWREMQTLYTALSMACPITLPALPVQYADYAVWQRQQVQGDVLESHLDYWRQQLADLPARSTLPTDHPRPLAQTFHGACQSRQLNATLSAALKALSQQEGVTLFMTLLAALQLLLQRHTGQDDIVIGAPMSGRNQPQTEALIGCFVNTLVLRTDLAGNPTFRDLLNRVREVVFGVYAHQDAPFEKVVAMLPPQRQHTPLFQVFLNAAERDEPPATLADLAVEAVPSPLLVAPFDITLYVRERQGQLCFDLLYNDALFTPEHMATVLAQLQHVLQQIVEHPEYPIARYSLVTPQAAELLPNPHLPLAEPQYALVTSMVTAIAASRPADIAVCQGEQTWTYEQLECCAEELAQHLLAVGLDSGEVVAICGAKSFGMIVSILGVLLSGGVFLLIDPALPVERQRLMLQEAAVQRLIRLTTAPTTQEPLAQSLPSAALLYVNPATGSRLNTTPSAPLHTVTLPLVAPDDAAYIFFTSGSTGTPKGVLGCHKGLSHFIYWQRETFEVTAQDRCAQLTALSFDVILRDIFLPLSSGATLCLPTADVVGGAAVLRWLERQEISLLHTVPTLLQSWLAAATEPLALRTLRWIFCSGEPLLDTLVKQWRATFPAAGPLVNFYGPTEATMIKCFAILPERVPTGIQPIGHALPNTQALVLNQAGQLCGIGEIGEIVLRTPFRSLGYINAPAEQAQRFRANPFSLDKTDVLYFTGDTGRYRSDGSLDVLGRLDNQVKVQGVRVEPDEIQAVLAQHPAVQACVVVAHTETPGHATLAAYVIPTDPAAVTAAMLRAYLGARLPAALVPHTFTFLSHFPRTSSGKIDKKALPLPVLPEACDETPFTTPHHPLEAQLARMWAEVLERSAVGTDDDFFALGGHSWQAVRLLQRLEQTYGIALPLAAIFQAPTVAQFASLLQEHGQEMPWTSLLAYKPSGRRTPFFCVHGVELMAHYADAEQPFYALHAHALDGRQAPESIDAMAAAYLREIRTIQPQGPYFLAGYSFGGLIAYEMAQQLQQQGQEVGLLVLLDTRAPQEHRYNPWTAWWKSCVHNLVLWFCQRYGSTGRRIPSRLRLRYFYALNWRALQAYTPQPYAGRIVLLRATDSPYVPHRGWEPLAIGGLEIYDIPGTHASLITPPHVQVLGERLAQVLRQAQQRVGALEPEKCSIAL